MLKFESTDTQNIIYMDIVFTKLYNTAYVRYYIFKQKVIFLYDALEHYVEASKFDHDLAGGGNSKVQLSVMCRVMFDILIAS